MSTAPASEPVFRGGGRARPLTIVRHSAARTLKLVVDPRDATVRLTLPHRQSLRGAVSWASGKRAWVEAQLDRLPQPQPIIPGMNFNIGDDVMMLIWLPERPRRVSRAGNQLLVGGPLDGLPARLLRWLRGQALETLARETHALAAAHGITVSSVGVGDPKARWGSCASSGAIRYSWRLILAPVYVRRATVAHEVAHLVHMNHGPGFHALVATLNGCDPAPARRWLRANGAALYWFGRDG